MSKKDNQIWVPLCALIFTSGVNYLLVHLWLADFFSKELAISYDAAYRGLTAFIVLMLVVRGVNIYRGQDWITNRIKIGRAHV